MGIILILAGIFTLVAAFLDEDWYFNSRRAKMWISVFGGRGNARNALMVFGVIIIIIGMSYH